MIKEFGRATSPSICLVVPINIYEPMVPRYLRHVGQLANESIENSLPTPTISQFLNLYLDLFQSFEANQFSQPAESMPEPVPCTVAAFSKFLDSGKHPNSSRFHISARLLFAQHFKHNQRALQLCRLLTFPAFLFIKNLPNCLWQPASKDIQEAQLLFNFSWLAKLAGPTLASITHSMVSRPAEKMTLHTLCTVLPVMSLCLRHFAAAASWVIPVCPPDVLPSTEDPCVSKFWDALDQDDPPAPAMLAVDVRVFAILFPGKEVSACYRLMGEPDTSAPALQAQVPCSFISFAWLFSTRPHFVFECRCIF